MQRLKDLMIYQDGGKIWNNLNSTQRRDYIYNAFLQKGYKPTQAAAIVGNLQQENDTFGTSRKNSIGALGIAQWLGTRKKALLNNYDKWHDIDNQIDFIHREIQGDQDAWTNKVGGKKAFFNTDSIDEATKIFRKDFERPGEHEANDKRRIKNAYAVLGKKFDSSLYQENNQSVNEIPLPESTNTTKFSGMTLADMNKFDFNTLPPSLQEGIILEQEKLNQDRVASQVEQENLAIQQALELQKQERSNMLAMLPKAQYVDSGIDRTNNYNTLLKNTPNTFQQGGSIINKNEINNIISKINPNNWFKTDYSDKPTYGQAYNAARQNGDKEFMYKGKRYNSDYKGTASQQLQQTGITNDQTHNRGWFERRMSANLNPVGYDPARNGFNDAIFNRKSPERIKSESEEQSRGRLDAFNIYTGLPQKHNTFSISQYKPSVSKNSNDVYYSINNSNTIDYILKNNLYKDGKIKLGSQVSSRHNPDDGLDFIMGNYTLNTGKDSRGEYISYYDKWDMSTMDFGKPFEIYDRVYVKDYGKGFKQMYLNDKELSNINPNNTNIVNIQKELLNRGYKLPNSIKQNGDVDGILGEETLEALQKFKKDYNIKK